MQLQIAQLRYTFRQVVTFCAAISQLCKTFLTVFFDVMQAGVSSRAQQLVKKQLDKWQEQSWEDEAYSQHIDEDRLLIYQLLAGQVHAITPRLNLDWRRALGLHFWCACQAQL